MKNPIDIRQLATDVLAGIAPEADLSTVGDHEDLREALDKLLADKFNLHYSVAELRAMGVSPLAPVRDDAKAVLFALEVAPGEMRYWLGLNNFYTITRYNKSTLYAMVAHELAQEIRNRYLAARFAATPAP